jgi:hypothetical protein
MLGPNLQASIQQQQSGVLRRGVASPQLPAFDKIRQRHLWSVFAFTTAAGGAVSNLGVVTPGDYAVFQVGQNANGQGLPQGFAMTELDTNLPGGGRVSDDQNIAVHELGASIVPLRPDVVGSNANITNEVVLGPLGCFVQPGGPSITAPTLLDGPASSAAVGAPPATVGGVGGDMTLATIGAGYDAVWSANAGNIPPAPALRRKLQVPVFLPATTTFQVIFRVSRSFKIRALLEGGRGGFALRSDFWAVESFKSQG